MRCVKSLCGRRQNTTGLPLVEWAHQYVITSLRSDNVWLTPQGVVAVSTPALAGGIYIISIDYGPLK
jgi:hypothetical protein